MIRYALFGLVQGLTEFLPVSSSGHLAALRLWWGLASPHLVVEAAAHLGTLLALLIYFRRDLVRLARGLVRGGAERGEVGLLFLGTVPLVLAGVWGQGVVEAAFASARWVGLGLWGTALALLGAQFLARRAQGAHVRWPQALGVGLAQVLALFPGVSRSGLTVAAGVALGVQATEAARFSFLLGIPAVAGAGLWALLQASRHGEVPWAGLGVVLSTAALTGLVAVHLFLSLLRRGWLWPFALYCLLLGAFLFL